MSTKKPSTLDRRRALRLLGGGIAVVTVGGLAGCGGNESSSTPAATPETPSTPEAERPPETAQAPTAEAPSDAPADPPPADTAPAQPARITEDDAQAQALGYRHDAANVDTAKFAGYQPGQACANCALYAGEADAEWAPCPIFGNREVNAKGWCSAYVAKPQA